MLLLKTIIKLCLLFVFSQFLLAKELLPEEFKSAKIDQNIGQYIYRDSNFTDSFGKNFNFSEFLDDKPILLNFVYYNCPRLCHFLADGIVNVLNELDADMYDRFKIITISFDNRDTIDNAAMFRDKYIGKLDQPDKVNWSFLIGNESNINLITNSVGFNFFYNSKINEYAHGASLIFLNAEGLINRYLYGIVFDPFDIKMSFLDSSNPDDISAMDSILLYCYGYDPDERGYVFEAMLLMKIVSSLSLILFSYCLYYLWTRYGLRN